MLSYRHGFHAGNHADLLKHLCLVGLLEALTAKPGPLCYFESHAGAGRYDLAGRFAQQNAEHAAGVEPALAGPVVHPLLQRYAAAVAAQNPAGGLRWYPGSPAFARELLRPEDRAILCELHPADATALRDWLAADRRFAVHRRDGLAAVKALLPPPQSRGLVLIDPSYELRGDYAAIAPVIATLRKRFRSAVIAVWYPALPGDPAAVLRRGIAAVAEADCLHCRLDLASAPRSGMSGSGMVIVQPPWRLADALRDALAELAGRLPSTARTSVSSGTGG